MKVLVVEDDKQLALHVKEQLEQAGYAVDMVHTATDGLFYALEFPYDCILLDITLPDGNGFSICEAIRDRGITYPILMMTARDAIEDKVTGLHKGADDYLTKPFHSLELVARVQALIRRSSKQPTPLIHISDLTIDPQARRVTRDSIEIALPTKEFAILEFLARHSDEVVTRTMLMEHIWGSDFETFSNVVDVYIKNLRQKIEIPKKQKLIHTIRGGGYVLSDKR